MMQDNTFSIKDEVRKLPETPGVYLMHNSVDEIIYVGKAINLKGRVSQYFHHNENRQVRIQRMIASIAWFEVITVQSELEALILESNLIKACRPRYNAALRDDENHPYLRVDLSLDYPGFSVTTDNKRDEAFYIGPFFKSMEIENALDFANKYFGLRLCTKDLSAFQCDGHPCMYYELRQCIGPCRGDVEVRTYHDQVEKAIQFFLSEDARLSLRADLECRMQQEVEQFAFEKAGRYKHMLEELSEIIKRLDFSRGEDAESIDLFSIARHEKGALILLYLIRNRHLSGRDMFFMDLSDEDKRTEGQILETFLEQFYQGCPFIPHKVIVSTRFPGQKKLAEQLSVMSGRAVSCICPQTGENGRFAALARENAQVLQQQVIMNKR